MKKSFVLFAVVLMFAMVAAAQDAPKMETFLGYTYVRANSHTNVSSYSSNGGGGQFAYNFNKYLGAVADIGAVHNGTIGNYRVDNTMTNFLFGPRLSMGYSRIRPYFQVLFGGVYYAASSQVSAIPVNPSQPIYLPGAPSITPIPGQPITARIGAQQTAFAMTAGGGLDIKINKHLSFRPIGLDYYMTRLQNLRTQNDNNQNNLRYTTGFNFNFGAR
jgi:Outer membrane protein beta-barrel domain